MTEVEFKAEVEKLKALAKSAMDLKDIKTINSESLQQIALVVKAVIAEINNIKTEVQGMTGEDAKNLAVDVLFGYLKPVLANNLKGIGKILFKILPDSVLKQLIGSVVDLVYHAIKEELLKLKKK
jgi:hypothetical protein